MSTEVDAFRNAAIQQHHQPGYLEVDGNARVSISDQGAYVQAWVFISKETAAAVVAPRKPGPWQVADHVGNA